MVAKVTFALLALSCAQALVVVPAGADEPDTKKPAAQAAKEKEEYLLRYAFRAGETVRWNVEHKARVRTTVSGTTQTAETTSVSVKRWKIEKAGPDGNFTFVHSVDSVNMRQKLTGREEQSYDSQSGDDPPAGYEDVAKAVGIPLTVITIDASGNVVRRDEKHPQPNSGNGNVTIPLPSEAVAVGTNWSQANEVTVRLQSGQIKTIKTRQLFRLKKVENGVATISIATQFLTPVRDPAIQVQLIQNDSTGTVRFDVEAGRVISQHTELDKRVVGFSGDASSMHYVTRFTETLLPASGPTAARPPRVTR